MSGNLRDLAQSVDGHESEINQGSAICNQDDGLCFAHVQQLRINLLVHLPKRTLDHECLGGFHSGRVSLRV